jgi:hypothetical protein
MTIFVEGTGLAELADHLVGEVTKRIPQHRISALLPILDSRVSGAKYSAIHVAPIVFQKLRGSNFFSSR